MSTAAPSLGEPLVHPTGRAPGIRRAHGVIGAIVLVVWVGLAAFVLAHGRGSPSGVDVYSQLPADFDTQLQATGVHYSGLSPVDGTTVKAVLASTSGAGTVTSDANALVFRTSFSTIRPLGSKKFTDQPALMVVVPGVRSGSGSSSSGVFVEFVDPVTFQVFTQLTYDGSSASPSASPSTSLPAGG